MGDGGNVLPVNGDTASLRLVKAENQPRQGGFASAGGADNGDCLAGRHIDSHSAQDFARRVIMEMHVLKPHMAGTDLQGQGARAILDFGVLVKNQEHRLNVDHRLLGLAVHHAHKIERDGQLDHQRVEQHKITQRVAAIADAHDAHGHDDG